MPPEARRIASDADTNMTIEDEPPAAVPDWILTYGDMMSLLLTFFIMLVSMSEMKSPEKFHAMADSMRQQFGLDVASTNFVPGWAKPRDSRLVKTMTTGRSRKQDAGEGDRQIASIAHDSSALMPHFRVGTLPRRQRSISRRLPPSFPNRTSKISRSSRSA